MHGSSIQFKKRAQSDSPLFWLRKHPKHPVSSGGYFYADKDLTNWYFDPERFDDKDWPSDEKGIYCRKNFCNLVSIESFSINTFQCTIYMHDFK